jgi:hypothetical protein
MATDTFLKLKWLHHFNIYNMSANCTVYLVHSAVQQEIKKREEEKRQEDLEKFCYGKTNNELQEAQWINQMSWSAPYSPAYCEAERRLKKLKEEEHRIILEKFRKEKREREEKLLGRFKNIMKTSDIKLLEKSIEEIEREDKLLDRVKNSMKTHHKRLEEMIEIEERKCLPPPNVSNGI